MENILSVESDILDAVVSDFDMDLSNGLYLGYEIVAFSGDWLIVWDGKYNYYLFDSSSEYTISRFKHDWMPSNHLGDALYKNVEFYTVFDTAVKNLCKVVANGGFFVFRRLV